MGYQEKLRDTFAAAALTGLLANQKYSVLNDGLADGVLETITASRAYDYADAMMKERFKREQDARTVDVHGDPLPKAGARPTPHPLAPQSSFVPEED